MSPKSGGVVSNHIRVFEIRIDVLNQIREFQIRIYVLNQGSSNQNSVSKNQNRCSKLEGIQHRPKKLQSVNFSKVKSVFKIREEVQNQNREFQNSI